MVNHNDLKNLDQVIHLIANQKNKGFPGGQLVK